MGADITGVLEMAKVRVQNAILDCNTIGAVWIDDNQLLIELDSGRTFALAMGEVKHQAKEFIEEI